MVGGQTATGLLRQVIRRTTPMGLWQKMQAMTIMAGMLWTALGVDTAVADGRWSVLIVWIIELVILYWTLFHMDAREGVADVLDAVLVTVEQLAEGIAGMDTGAGTPRSRGGTRTPK